MIEMTVEEKWKQPLPIMKQKEYQVLYKLMLKNYNNKTQNLISEELKKPEADIVEIFMVPNHLISDIR